MAYSLESVTPFRITILFAQIAHSLNLHFLLLAFLPTDNVVPPGEALPEIGFSARLIREPFWANV